VTRVRYVCFHQLYLISSCQVSIRVLRILRDYENRFEHKAKAVCFCLTKASCRSFAESLIKGGLTAEVLDGDANDNLQTPEIVSRFKRGDTQVLCVTKGTCLREM
jgi:superfamily II DNA/RNA helicase